MGFVKGVEGNGETFFVRAIIEQAIVFHSILILTPDSKKTRQCG